MKTAKYFVVAICLCLLTTVACAQNGPTVHQVVLSWTVGAQPNGVTLAGFYVYRSTTATPLTPAINTTIIPATTLTYTDYNVVAGTTYNYWVTAQSTTKVESAYSSMVTAAVPQSPAPPTLGASPSVAKLQIPRQTRRGEHRVHGGRVVPDGTGDHHSQGNYPVVI